MNANAVSIFTEQPNANSLERGLAMLYLIGQKPGGMTHAEIGRMLCVPKSTCSYILHRLVQFGYITHEPQTGRYRIGLKILILAHDALREVGFRTVSEPALYRLANETGLAASIGVLERGRVLVVDRVEGAEFIKDAVEMAGETNPLAYSNVRRKYPLREDRDIGREMPIDSTALGKVLLAYLPAPQLQDFLHERQTEKRPGEAFTRPRHSLLMELEQIRKVGYSLADHRSFRGTGALGAPIFGATGEIRAAVCVDGCPHVEAWKDLTELSELVRAAGREISKRLR
jgi:IclR family KDG regulon transcriptional repressor